MSKPYLEEKDTRIFLQGVSDFELVWHRDKEDRLIKALHTTDWQFQLDNETPQVLSEKELFIPKETYHRLIKGTGDLKLRVKKLRPDETT